MGSDKKLDVILNRDIPLLESITATMQTVCADENAIEWMNGRMFFITQKFNKTPGGGGVSSGFDATLAELGEKAEEYNTQIKRCMRELKKAERILNDIQDVNVRTFVVMNYVMRVPPIKIKRELNMTDWGYRMACEAVEQSPCMAEVRLRMKNAKEDGFSTK